MAAQSWAWAVAYVAVVVCSMALALNQLERFGALVLVIGSIVTGYGISRVDTK